MPAEHSRACVGLELKSRVGKYGFKTIKPRAWRTPAGSVCSCDENKVRVTTMNKTNYGKCHISGDVEKQGQRETETPHQSISTGKWCARNQRWECQLMQRCQESQQPKKSL